MILTEKTWYIILETAFTSFELLIYYVYIYILYHIFLYIYIYMYMQTLFKISSLMKHQDVTP